MKYLHRLYASAMGYFWLPCSICDEYFGGHQWRDRKGNPSSLNNKAICPKCTKQGLGYRPWPV